MDKCPGNGFTAGYVSSSYCMLLFVLQSELLGSVLNRVCIRCSQDHELTGKWCIVGWVPTVRITPDTDIGLGPRLVRPTLTFKVKPI